jgi:raffinose/stachyose/melibiose transport system permease protein
MSSNNAIQLAESRVSRTTGSVIIAVATLVVIFPLFWTVRLALRPRDSYLANPAGLDGGLTLSNFVAAWNSGVQQGMVNSLLVVPLAAIVATMLAALAGYALAKYYIPAKKPIMGILACTFAVPVTALAVPVFDQALQFGYLGTHLGLSMVYSAMFTGWGTLFLISYYTQLPVELLEAASIDGAGKWRTFWSIALPLGAPAVVTVLVMNFFMMWGDLIIALVMMPTERLRTLSSVVAALPSARESTATTSAAAALLMLIPVLLLFLLSQRWLKSEVLSGAVKN